MSAVWGLPADIKYCAGVLAQCGDGEVGPKAKPSESSVACASVLEAATTWLLENAPEAAVIVVDDAGRPRMLPLVEAARLALDDFRAEHGEFA